MLVVCERFGELIGSQLCKGRRFTESQVEKVVMCFFAVCKSVEEVVWFASVLLRVRMEKAMRGELGGGDYIPDHRPLSRFRALCLFKMHVMLCVGMLLSPHGHTKKKPSH